MLSLIIYILSPALIAVAFKPYLPHLPFMFFGLAGVVLSMLVSIFHFSLRYGFISFSELIPRYKDLPVLLIALIVIFVFLALAKIGGGWKNNSMAQLRNAGEYQAIIGFISIIVIAPILEEILWRKYVFEILRQSYSVVIAVLVTVCVETAFHFGTLKQGISPVIIIFLSLLLYTVVYLKSRLGVSIIVHSLMNGYILALSIRG